MYCQRLSWAAPGVLSRPEEPEPLLDGSYVIIVPRELAAEVEPLAAWNRRKGLEVRVATTTETGTAREDIHAWLRTAYVTQPLISLLPGVS